MARLCSHGDCSKPSVSRGFCRVHYQKWRRSSAGQQEVPSRTCSYIGCNRIHFAYGFCNLHYQRMKTEMRLKHGAPEGHSKECAKCSEIKPFADFSIHSGTADGRRPECRACHATYHRESRRDNPDRHRKYEAKSNYGITPELYDKMLEEHEHRCAICGSREGGKFKTLNIDHCHNTGKIRGLLCHLCNRGLGLFKDDPVLLEKAIAYLRDRR